MTNDNKRKVNFKIEVNVFFFVSAVGSISRKILNRPISLSDAVYYLYISD